MKETQEGCLSRAISINFACKIYKPGKLIFRAWQKSFLRNFVSPLRPHGGGPQTRGLSSAAFLLQPDMRTQAPVRHRKSN